MRDTIAEFLISLESTQFQSYMAGANIDLALEGRAATHPALGCARRQIPHQRRIRTS